MIECPFCNESIEEEDLVFEFNWGDVVSYYSSQKKINIVPNDEFKDRAFYVRFKFDLRGRPMLKDCSPVVNPEKHPGKDPMCDAKNGWDKIKQQLSQKKVFEIESDKDDASLPVSAKIMPLVKEYKKYGQRGSDRKTVNAEGVSTGMFCPVCEQRLKAELLKAQSEIRILLSGRPGSGKTVYATQVISELKLRRLTQNFSIEPANQSVEEHYLSNKNRLKVSGNSFVLATNPGTVQEPYVFLMKNGKNSIRLVIQDIAGEDAENRIKYSTVVRKADMVLFFVDPWHIEELRCFHERNMDQCNDIVNRSVQGRYTDLRGVFDQMMSVVTQDFTEESGQLAGVLLIKGDYLNPPMLSQGDQPECQMMRQPIPFRDPEALEFSLAMRSSFIRQLMHEWDSTRSFSLEVENKYSARNTRYFVASALGQSTHLRYTRHEGGYSEQYMKEDPDAQFMVNDAVKAGAESSETWEYGEQVLESPAHAEHVIDPIFWCLKRKGIKLK